MRASPRPRLSTDMSTLPGIEPGRQQTPTPTHRPLPPLPSKMMLLPGKNQSHEPATVLLEGAVVVKEQKALIDHSPGGSRPTVNACHSPEASPPRCLTFDLALAEAIAQDRRELSAKIAADTEAWQAYKLTNNNKLQVVALR